jgi:hypothetical protein
MNGMLGNSSTPKTTTATIVALIVITAVVAFPLAITDKAVFASDPKKKSS